MTQPDQLLPDSAANYSSFSAYAAKTQDEWYAELTGAEEDRWGNVQIGLFARLNEIADMIGSILVKLPIIGDIIEVISGKEDGDLNDLGTAVNGIISGIQQTINGIVNALFGWLGSGFGNNDADQALMDAAETIAGLSAAVTALQNNLRNSEVGGVSALVDFTALPSGSTFGSDFTHARSGGTGQFDIVNGSGAVWDPGYDSDATDEFTYDELTTTTDYQKVWIAFGSAPEWFLSSSTAGVNEIHARKNRTENSYVYAKLHKYRAELGCCVGGTRTVFATKTSGFSFKAQSIYSLECGDIGGDRVYRLREGGTAILTHTEVGTTAELGADYRDAGGLGSAVASWLGSNDPGTMWAFAVSDNYPAPVLGTGALMYRTATGDVSISSGTNVLPNNFFDNKGATSTDITSDLTTGKFTVSAAGWYHIQARSARDNSPPHHLELILYKNGSADLEMGQDSVVGNGLYPSESIAGSVDVYLDIDDYVQVGYIASASAGDLTGDGSGNDSYFSIVRTGLKSPEAE